MKTRFYPLVTALALLASAVLLVLPPPAAACADKATALITDPNHPLFAEQMVLLYRQWGAQPR